MRKFWLAIIGLIAVISLLVSCGGGGGGGGSSSGGSSVVSITVPGVGQEASIRVEKNTFFAQAKTWFARILKPDTAVAAVPASIYKYSFAISGTGMNTITKDTLVAGRTEITESFTVPNGINRHFLVEGKNASGEVIYAGEISSDLNGAPIILSIEVFSMLWEESVWDGSVWS